MSNEENVGNPTPWNPTADTAENANPSVKPDKDSSPAEPQTVEPDEGTPEQTDNSERPEDGEQDVDQEPNLEDEEL